MRPAAAMPQACDRRRTPWTKCSKLLDAQRGVDELLAVGDFLRELLVRALLRHLNPCVVFGRRERHDLDLVLLERLDHLVVESLGLLGEIRLGLAPGGEERL